MPVGLGQGQRGAFRGMHLGWMGLWDGGAGLH